MFVDYLHKGHTMNGEYYDNLLRELQKVIKTKYQRKLPKGVLFTRQYSSTNPWFQWLLYGTLAINWLTFLSILLIWPYLTIMSYGNEKTFGEEPVMQWRWCHICCWCLLLPRGWKFLHQIDPSISTSMEEVYGSQGWTTLKNKSHSVISVRLSWSVYELFSWGSY